MTDKSYASFLASKVVGAKLRGLDRVPELALHLFPFQRECVDFALRAGCAGLFLDTGLGKTECQLEWCQKAIEATNQKALILTPLAVAGQTKRRADRWGYEARVIREQSQAGPGINICNYDRLDNLDTDAFAIVALDEASILKSFTGKTTRKLIEAFRGHRFKLVATATPAPNDHMELGNYAEYLEIMAANEMLSRFFINDTSTASQQWRLKGHATNSFWDWMASFARMAERPSDITGNPRHDEGFALPPFEVVRHRARDSAIDRDFGNLFGVVDMSATNMFEIKRQTTAERAKLAAEIVYRELGLWTGKNAAMRAAESGTPQIQNTVNSESEARSLIRMREKNITLNTISETRKPTDPVPRNEPENATVSSEKNTKTTQNTGRRARPRLGSETSGKSKNSDRSSVRQTIEPSYPTKMALASSAGLDRQEGKADGSTLTTAMQPAWFADCYAPAATSDWGISETIQKTSVVLPTTLMAMRMPAWVLWCDTNDEQAALERELGDLCISIRGSQSADEKEALHQAWIDGTRPVLVTKPSIFGFGCDWQHCARMIFVGRTFSYETWYQAVRRCWRFGQKEKVIVHLIVAEGENEIGRVIDRKAGDHDGMKRAMRDAMRRAAQSIETKTPYNPQHKTRLPSWICAA